MRMMRCKAQLTVQVTGTSHLERFWPGKDVDFDRVLRPALPAEPGHGSEGDPNFEMPRPALPAYTVADAMAGYEHHFEPTPDVEPNPDVEHTLSQGVVTDIVDAARADGAEEAPAGGHTEGQE